MVRRTAALLLLAACSSPPRPVTPVGPLAAAESVYLDLRDARDRIDVAHSAARSVTSDGIPIPAMVERHNELRQALIGRLGAVDSARLREQDASAFATMRATLARDLAPIGRVAPAASSAASRPRCDYDAGAIARTPRGLDSLRARIYACYAWAQHRVVVGSDTLDRLSVLGALSRTDDAAERRRLFLALTPVWRSINGTNGRHSPYRRLVALEASRSRGRELTADRQARLSGISAEDLDRWLVAILSAWRDVTPDSLIEPWDWYHQNGRLARVLGDRVSRPRLTSLNAEVYRSLGADLTALNVRFDLGPRDGKTPVAFCTFGSRPRRQGGGWTPGEPSVFATYREGGLDNLTELLHETGHAVHIAAIRTRPAFTDWPDSDPFTEAVADLVALDVHEPRWQQRWLGDSVPLADGLRARYGSIVLDVAWAMFEIQMLADPTLDPNELWAFLTSEYLRIRPHPELSWWAMRGQLVDAPGYMTNYAVGAILSAALRARMSESRAASSQQDHDWYRWVAPRLFRYGLERPTREVIEEFLGSRVTPDALLADMARMKN